MSVNNVQHLAILGLASMAFADLAKAASESGNESLNQMFNEGGVGYEASQAVKQVMSQPMDRESAIQIAMHLLRVAEHPLVEVYDAAQAGQLLTCIHSHGHGVDAFMVIAEDGYDIKNGLQVLDPIRFELDREDEFLDTVVTSFNDLRPLDLRPFEEEEESEVG